VIWIDDPITGAGIPVPDEWTVLDGGGNLPLIAVDTSGGHGVYAPTIVVSVVALGATDALHEFADRNGEAWGAADASAITLSTVEGELDGVPVRETLVSTLVGSSGVSTISHFLVAHGLGVRFDVSVEAWDTLAARELARSILAQAHLPVRPPAEAVDSHDLGALIESAITAAAPRG